MPASHVLRNWLIKRQSCGLHFKYNSFCDEKFRTVLWHTTVMLFFRCTKVTWKTLDYYIVFLYGTIKLQIRIQSRFPWNTTPHVRNFKTDEIQKKESGKQQWAGVRIHATTTHSKNLFLPLCASNKATLILFSRLFPAFYIDSEDVIVLW